MYRLQNMRDSMQSQYGVLDYKRSKIRMIRNDDYGLDIVTVCTQCDEKPCIDACPVGAISPNEDGTIRIGQECTSCGKCKRVCPYSGPQPDVRNSIYIVCDLCGGAPQCVEWCPFEALDFTEPGGTEEYEKHRVLVERIEKENRNALKSSP